MSDYVFINWTICILTSLLLLISIWLDRSLLVKPSIIFLLFFHLMIQWAATIESPMIETYLRNPWDFAMLAQGFPLIGVCVSLVTWRSPARIIWRRLRSAPTLIPRQRDRAIFWLGLYFLLFVPYYLSQIPFTSTGLYTIFTNPLASDIARENSLKLVSNPVVTYGYSFMAAVFGPLLAILLADKLIEDYRHTRWSGIIFAGLGLAFVLFSVSLTGARSYPATILLTVLLAWLYRRGLPVNPVYVGAAAVLILGIPTVLSIWREGGVVVWTNFWQYLGGGIFWRVFYLPMEMGLWHVDYYQAHGPFGIQAIPRLANLFGVPPINVPNIIALAYTESTFSSIIANTSYVFAYYSYFGPWSFVFSLLGVWALDFILLAYNRISDRMLLPLVASIAVASIWFTSIEYTVVLLTNGFLALPVIAWVIDRLARIRFRFAKTVPTNIFPSADPMNPSLPEKPNR